MFAVDVMLEYHLQYNHYPPLGSHLIPYAKQAIEAYNEGDPDRIITAPSSQEFHASTLVEDWHLECFIENESEDYF